MYEEPHPIEIKVSQPTSRTGSAPRAPKRTVNIRPAAALASNAAIAGTATLYAVAGATGLWAAGTAIVGGTAMTIAKARAKAKKEAAAATRKAATPAERRAAAVKKAAASPSRTTPGKGIRGAISKAAKAAGAALTAPKRAVTNGRAAAAKSTSPRQAAAKAKRRAQVAAAAKGKKANSLRGTGSALMGGMSHARKAWKKSRDEAKKKKAAAVKKKAAAAKKVPQKKVGKTVRKDPRLTTAAPEVIKKDQLSSTPIAPIAELPALPVPGAPIPAPLTSGGNAMSSSYSPMRAMLEFAEEMTRAAQRWDPVGTKVGMIDVTREFALWPEVIAEVTKAAKIISDKASDPKDGLPLNPLILSVIESVQRNQGAVVATAEEVPTLIKSLHRKQFEVLEETPHHANNDMWSYSANREAV